MTGLPPTIAEAIGTEIDRRGTIQARAAEEMGIAPSKLTRWITDGAEPDGESLECLAAFLGFASIYELGPLLVATKMERARRRGRL
jgi:transcriptional regulator with XRE-family HTH domain